VAEVRVIAGIRSAIDTLTPLVPTPQMYSAGETYDLGSGGGFGLNTLEFDSSTFIASDSGACLYQGTSPLHLYIPQCVGGTAIDSSQLLLPPGALTYTQDVYRSLGAGTWGLGSYNSPVGLISQAHALNMWLDYQSGGVNKPPPPSATSGGLPRTSPESSWDRRRWLLPGLIGVLLFGKMILGTAGEGAQGEGSARFPVKRVPEDGGRHP
jgi:hypothetical protein